MTSLDGAPRFTFDDAVSLLIDLRRPGRGRPLLGPIDRRWWGARSMRVVKNRFGFSWQVVPRGFVELVTGPDPVRTGRAFAAMMSMSKLDLASLTAAADGD